MFQSFEFIFIIYFYILDTSCSHCYLPPGDSLVTDGPCKISNDTKYCANQDGSRWCVTTSSDDSDDICIAQGQLWLDFSLK